MEKTNADKDSYEYFNNMNRSHIIKNNYNSNVTLNSSATDMFINNKFKYDIFISHASEDKKEVAYPLAYELKKSGLNIWYDEFELKIGVSISKAINLGLSNSSFGIVIISRAFINKKWTNFEFNEIFANSISKGQILLPIWHNITKEEVIKFSPYLEDKFARNTSEFTVIEIANEIIEVVNSKFSYKMVKGS